MPILGSRAASQVRIGHFPAATGISGDQSFELKCGQLPRWHLGCLELINYLMILIDGRAGDEGWPT